MVREQAQKCVFVNLCFFAQLLNTDFVPAVIDFYYLPQLFSIYNLFESQLSNVNDIATETAPYTFICIQVAPKSLKNDKPINYDLKLLDAWQRANRISPNANKTEIILFRPKPRENITTHLNYVKYSARSN